ncbi:universal stress protein [Microlunatus panaciterrae]|uniref:Nucleotide-binding universal stress UspA family protein n=1 Tax=Microlunatus panaciterrae TaxID=400768 RepID=A0ABS2RE02_9ACTN|nr:universal stress protein [Microlunatus panaciterrae]MBM7797216.1 nucleotide-binding universal stress UspA family protein [Microlunatus panaciterrae]
MNSTTTAPLPVIACIDGTKKSDRVVAWAAHQARVQQTELVVVQVRPFTLQTSPSRAGRGADITAVADYAAAATRRHPSIPVTARLVRGRVSEELINLSRHAAQLVIGSDRTRDHDTEGRLASLGEVLAVSALCPVVVVASSMTGAQSPPRVVVGWAPNAPASDYALREAAAQAYARSAQLMVIILNDFQPVPRNTRTVPAVVTTPLHVLVEELQHLYPGLAIRTRRGKGRVAEGLATAAIGAELLVVGCHHSANPWSLRTGPTAVTLMRTSPCPLMLVGTRSRRTRPVAASALRR